MRTPRNEISPAEWSAGLIVMTKKTPKRAAGGEPLER
jgi:hypothetical protein